MEIDKKIIKKLVEALDELKKSLKDKDFSKVESSITSNTEEIDSGIIIKKWK